MDCHPPPFGYRIAFRLTGERDGRPNRRIGGIPAKPKFPPPFVIPAVKRPARMDHFENQTPALAHENA